MKISDDLAMPDWELLTSWVAVVETGSVSAAARLMGVSQAAISQRIKLLEGICATALLDRSTRPAQPTAAGQRLFENAKELITRANQMMESVRNVSRARRMIVRFGCVDSFAATVGPLMIRALSGSSHQIRLWSGITPMLDRLLENRQLDLAVTTGTTTAPGIARVQLFHESYVVVVPASLDPRRYTSLSEVGRNLHFIRYSARSLIGQQVDDYLQRTGDSLERTCEFDATDPLLSLVASGMGFALTTPLCIWQSRQFLPKISVVPLSVLSRQSRPYPEMSRAFYLAYRQGELGTLPNEVRDLIRIAVRKQLSVDIRNQLDLEEDAIWAHEDRD